MKEPLEKGKYAHSDTYGGTEEDISIYTALHNISSTELYAEVII